MKKILFLIALSFACLTNVIADECSSSSKACAKCVYEANTFKLEYLVKSDGGSSATLTYKVVEDDSNTPSLPIKVTNNLKGANFVDTAGNKIKCLSKIYYKGDASQTGIFYEVYSKQPSDSKATMTLHSSSTNNDKFLNGKEESDGKTISCPYTSETLVGTTYKDGPTVTVTSDGKDKLDIKAEDGWQVNKSKSKVTADDFMKSGKLECPALYASCGGDGDNKFCTVSTEKLTSTGSEAEKPEAESDANETEAENNKQYFEVKPNINVSLNFGEGDCGVISEDLHEFLQWVLDTVRIVGIVLTIVLSILDYAKASFSSNDDAMKQANKSFTTRLLSAAILLLIPAIVELALTLFDVGITADDPSCGIS